MMYNIYIRKDVEIINERMYTIYMHITPDNRKYIGMTMQKPKNRYINGYGYRHSTRFYEAIKFFGWENIKHEILSENLSKESAELLEKELILKYRSNEVEFGFNIKVGTEMDDDTRLKIKIANSGENNPLYGKHLSQEHKKSLSKSLIGKKRTENTKALISRLYTGEGNPNYGKYRADSANSKSVICITTGKVFKCILDAADFYDIKSSTHISSCCNGKRKSCGIDLKTGEKLIWMYYEDYLANGVK